MRLVEFNLPAILLIITILLVLTIIILPRGTGCFWRIPDPSLSYCLNYWV